MTRPKPIEKAYEWRPRALAGYLTRYGDIVYFLHTRAVYDIKARLHAGIDIAIIAEYAKCLSRHSARCHIKDRRQTLTRDLVHIR